MMLIRVLISTSYTNAASFNPRHIDLLFLKYVYKIGFVYISKGIISYSRLILRPNTYNDIKAKSCPDC